MNILHVNSFFTKRRFYYALIWDLLIGISG
jgi:hypothetical protein